MYVGLLQTSFVHGQPVIEARLRVPATMILYEICRVQKLGPVEMGKPKKSFASNDDIFTDFLGIFFPQTSSMIPL
jgi:hypothetical protein